MDDGRPHDEFFKLVLSLPGVASALLRERLPPELVRLFAPGAPVELAGEFVSDALRATHADKLYRVATALLQPAAVFCVVEHKSAGDSRAPFQVLRYVAEVLYLQSIEQATPPAPVTTLVVSHGAAPWAWPRRLSAILDPGCEVPTTVGLPDYTYSLFDLGAVDDAHLSEHPVLQAGLLVLKYGTRPGEQRRRLPEVLRAVHRARLPLKPTLVYIARAYREVDLETLLALVRDQVPETEDEMMSIAETLIAQGRIEGRAQGQMEGRLEYARSHLRRLLERRFGPVPASVVAQIDGADLATLDGWLFAAAEAGSIDEVLGTPRS